MSIINIDQARETAYQLSEAYKSIRTNIEFCGSDVKAIAITSCTANEGKTTASLNVAISLADAGKKVLYIDADLRKSVIVGRYHIGQQIQGLSHFLSGKNTINDVLYPTSVKNLHMIVAGPVPPNPAELLGNRYFKGLMEAARKSYDYIIVDLPPLGPVIDAAVVAKECDGSILIVASGNVSYKFAQSVKLQLEKSGCRVLGVILNKVAFKDRGVFSKYYGKYYGGYYGDYGSYFKSEHKKSK